MTKLCLLRQWFGNKIENFNINGLEIMVHILSDDLVRPLYLFDYQRC